KVDKPPTVSVTTPLNGADVSGVVRVRVSAADDFGIRYVAFFINNLLKKKDNSSPYDFEWDTVAVANGVYGIKAVVTDSIGQTAHQAIQVSVLPHAPLNPTGEKKDNSSALLEEFVDILIWEANLLDSGITAYRVYLFENGAWTRIAEVGADVFAYLHRDVDKDVLYSYALRAVDAGGREGVSAWVDIR
ncbi:MAG: Ig-like domain-containing protein, partial [Candidatus Aminicenantes bacterium]|nr:Ig-like domain-containing protein [Candidatus Aminicenantes bacterium]